MRHQEILFGITGQSFYLDTPDGRPDADPPPTCAVYLATNADIAGPETATTGSVAIEAIDTTLAEDADATTNTLELASATGVRRGRRFLVTSADGSLEWIEVAGVAGSTVTTKRPLSNARAAGSTFQSTRMSIAVNDTWAADQSRLSDILGVTWRTDREPRTEWLAGYVGYRVRWAYSVGGVATVTASFADLARYSAKNLITPLDIEDRFPGWINRLPTDYQADQGAALLCTAFYALKMDAVGDDQALRRIRNTEILGALVAGRAAVIVAENQVIAGGGSADAVRTAREVFKQLYDQLLRAPKFQVDQTGAGQSAQARPLPLFRR